MSEAPELGTLKLEDGRAVIMTTIPARLARETVEAHHYLHRKPAVSFAYGLMSDGEILGAVTFGTPASRHLQMGVCPSDPGLMTELNRLWVHDAMPTNTASWFVSRALKNLPPRIVASYADTTRGHLGYVYRALNFHYAGWTDMERKTPRYDYLPADPSVHTRDAFRNGYASKVRRKPKIKYWTVTGNRSDRRRLTGLCGWPILSMTEYPPPVEHRHQPVR